MAITYVAIGTRVDTGSGTPTLPYPAGIAENDTLICCSHKRLTANTPAAPSNTLTWTERVSLGTHMKIWTALYDGSATAPTVATGGQSMYAIMLAVRGASTSTPVDATAGLDAGTQTAMHYPGLTIANDNEFILTYSRNTQSNSGVAPTASFNEIEDSQPTSGGTNSVYLQYLIQTSKSNISGADLSTTSGGSGNQFGVSISIVAASGIIGGVQIAGGFQTLSGNLG